MRPGPGLVVMALAFISGARRGTSQQTSPSQGGKLGKSGDDDTGALVRLNPWLSACDLAQPSSAPDLQGQCSASNLPVAWVDEGPGPPSCPQSCESLRFQEKYNNINYINNNNNMENRFNEKQQCLDYLGENEESSPAQICEKSMRDIHNKIKTLRLRHCCERSAISALHNEALDDVLNGGLECIKTLNDLLENDALSARITCELSEILIRYDCRQQYSLIHHCEDCKEAYRRWVCSTLIPYFAEPNDIRPNVTIFNNSSSTNSTKTKVTNPFIASSSSTSLQVSGEDPLLSRVLRRSRRKSRTETIRQRIRPCLSVCQTVEQKCPYFLPADRAPAHPTQYAGEPTFLCLDPNIAETGEQEVKSNNGPGNCCYNYCGSAIDGLCSYCETIVNQTDNELLPSQIQIAQCQSTPTNTTPSQNPCQYPVFVTSSSTSLTMLTTKTSNLYKISNLITLTILWSLFNVAAWTKVYLQLAGS